MSLLIFNNMQAGELGNIRTTSTCVLVASAGKNLTEERMKLCKELWANDIAVSESINYKDSKC